MAYRVITYPADLEGPLEIRISNALGEIQVKTSSYTFAIDWLIEHGVHPIPAEYLRHHVPLAVYYLESDPAGGDEEIPA